MALSGWCPGVRGPSAAGPPQHRAGPGLLYRRGWGSKMVIVVVIVIMIMTFCIVATSRSVFILKGSIIIVSFDAVTIVISTI